MRKEIKQYGNSAVIVFDTEDMKVYNLKVGDILDIELCKINLLPKSKSNKEMLKDIKTEVRK